VIGTRTALAALAVIAAAPANADVTISTAATQNMSCSGGVCQPTAMDAVLNVTDLENLLASGNVEVTTTGSGIQANNIDITGAFSWSDSSTLTLDAYQSLAVNAPVSIQGLAGLTILTNDGGSNGTFLFGAGANVTFANLSSSLSINGLSYILVNSLPTLASAVAGNASGAFALANNYDASQDGTYSSSPITTTFTGAFDGLGNTISQLSVDDISGEYTGLFETLGSSGIIENVRLAMAKIDSAAQAAGGLVGRAEGTIVSSSVSLVRLDDSYEYSVSGGLVGVNASGTVSLSHATGPVFGGSAGGLVGLTDGVVDQCYAAGKAHGVGPYGYAGGLVGYLYPGGTILNSYATGATRGRYGVGGLVGTSYTGEHSRIASAYSTGVQRPRDSIRGGFLGLNEPGSTRMKNAYWDTTTSGTTKGVGRGRSLGVAGLTQTQLQSGLPTGFGPKFWAENPHINNGLPYLINNPPPN
jgi:hypothetical protein